MPREILGVRVVARRDLGIGVLQGVVIVGQRLSSRQHCQDSMVNRGITQRNPSRGENRTLRALRAEPVLLRQLVQLGLQTEHVAAALALLTHQRLVLVSAFLALDTERLVNAQARLGVGEHLGVHLLSQSEDHACRSKIRKNTL